MGQPLRGGEENGATASKLSPIFAGAFQDMKATLSQTHKPCAQKSATKTEDVNKAGLLRKERSARPR